MGAVHTLVAEVLAELVNTVETADDKLLEVELRSDSHIEVDIECVVVSDERTSRCTSRNGLQNRGLNFEVALRVEELAHSRDNLRALNEDVANVGVNRQIDITLAIAYLRVGKCIEGLAILLLYDGERTQ